MSSSHSTSCCMPDNERGAERDRNQQERNDGEEDSDGWRRGWPSLISEATFCNRWVAPLQAWRPSWPQSGFWYRQFEGGRLSWLSYYILGGFCPHYHDLDIFRMSQMLCKLQILSCHSAAQLIKILSKSWYRQVKHPNQKKLKFFDKWDLCEKLHYHEGLQCCTEYFNYYRP